MAEERCSEACMKLIRQLIAKLGSNLAEKVEVEWHLTRVNYAADILKETKYRLVYIAATFSSIEHIIMDSPIGIVDKHENSKGRHQCRQGGEQTHNYSDQRYLAVIMMHWLARLRTAVHAGEVPLRVDWTKQWIVT